MNVMETGLAGSEVHYTTERSPLSKAKSSIRPRGGILKGAPNVTEFTNYSQYIQAELVNLGKQREPRQQDFETLGHRGGWYHLFQ